MVLFTGCTNKNDQKDIYHYLKKRYKLKDVKIKNTSSRTYR